KRRPRRKRDEQRIAAGVLSSTRECRARRVDFVLIEVQAREMQTRTHVARRFGERTLQTHLCLLYLPLTSVHDTEQPVANTEIGKARKHLLEAFLCSVEITLPNL